MDPVKEGQQYDLVLPSNSVALGVYHNRPQGFRVDLPAPLNLVGAGWEVGLSELLYTHTFFEPPPVTLGNLDRTVGIEPGYNGVVYAELPLHPYKDFKSLAKALVIVLSRYKLPSFHLPPSRFRWTLPPKWRVRFPLPLARLLGFVHANVENPTSYEDYSVARDYTFQPQNYYINKGSNDPTFVITSRNKPLVFEVDEPFLEWTDDDLGS